jgi:hypothetical protein
MKTIATFIGLAVMLGCSQPSPPDSSSFSLHGETNGVFLAYDTKGRFTVTLWARGDRRSSTSSHLAGHGRIKLFQDKGAIWMSEEGQGYGCFAPVHSASLLPATEMTEEGNHVFRVGRFRTEQDEDDVILLKVEQTKGEPER